MLALTWQHQAGAVRAQDAAAGRPADAEKRKIMITADALVSDSDARWAEFIGNVRAAQGDTVITSDRLKVFQKSGDGENGPAGGGMGAIERIEAEGNVKIAFDNKTAFTDRAVYRTENGKRVVTMEGGNSKIISGDSHISGSRIILRLDEGRIKVEGGAGAPVRGVFFSNDTME